MIDGGAGDDQVAGGSGADTISDTSGLNVLLGEAGNDVLIFADTAGGAATGGDGDDTFLDASSGSVAFSGGTGNDAFSHNGNGLTFIDDSSGGSDLLLFSNVANLGTLDFLRDGNNLVFAAQGDESLSNAVVVRDWFSSTDSVDYIANSNSTQILNLYEFFA